MRYLIFMVLRTVYMRAFIAPRYRACWRILHAQYISLWKAMPGMV